MEQIADGGLLWRVDGVLRGRRAPAQATDTTAAALRQWLAFVLLSGLFYGALMGSFGGGAGPRPLQMACSAAKVPLLLLVTFALSLPSFFVINTLAGLRDDFTEALRALISAQAALAIVLASLAPFTLLWYASSSNYRAAILFNTLMFAVASLSSQRLLLRAYRVLIARSDTHRIMLRLWIVLYAFVGIQLGWVLRPFIGSPDTPVQFMREGGWDNAYVIVFQMLRGVGSRSYY